MELTVFRQHSHRIPEVCIYYRNIKLRVVPKAKVKYLGLFFEDGLIVRPELRTGKPRLKEHAMAKLKKDGANDSG